MRYGLNKNMMQLLCLQQFLHEGCIQTQLIQLMPYDILLLRLLQQSIKRIQGGWLSFRKRMRAEYMDTASCFQLLQIEGNEAVIQTVGSQKKQTAPCGIGCINFLLRFDFPAQKAAVTLHCKRMGNMCRHTWNSISRRCLRTGCLHPCLLAIDGNLKHTESIVIFH